MHVAPLEHNILANNFLFLLPKSVCLAKKQHTDCIVFGLTPSGSKRTIYRTRVEHLNNYTTNVVINFGLLDFLVPTMLYNLETNTTFSEKKIIELNSEYTYTLFLGRRVQVKKIIIASVFNTRAKCH
jgi:hypothetical protein